jgi:hypothetical protein
MSKDRKVRNFDFLKQTPSELPSREEVIQKTAELTGQTPIGAEDPSVSAAVDTISAPEVVPAKATVAAKSVEKAAKAPPRKEKVVKTPASPPPAVEVVVEKSKVGRKALVDTRKPFTTTITVDNKRQLRQLCAEYDIAMSDVINEILAAHFEKRPPSF